MAEQTAPTWGTTKTHGRPARLMYHGGIRKAPTVDGVLVTVHVEATAVRLLDASTGKPVDGGGTAFRYWAAPAPAEQAAPAGGSSAPAERPTAPAYFRAEALQLGLALDVETAPALF